MNCKQGDLAVIVKSWAGNEGKIVRCVKYLGVGGFYDAHGVEDFSHAWEIDQDIPDFLGVLGRVVEDCQLRPIRPQADDATDETLTWLDVPTKQGETA